MFFCTLQSRRGWLAAAVLLCAGIGCATPGRQADNPRPLELTAAENQRAAALAHYAMAVSVAATQGMEAALPEYRQAHELDPGNLSLDFLLAEYYRVNHDLTNALAILHAAIIANPKSAEPWVAQGLTYRSAEDSGNAIRAFQHALRLDPVHPGAVRALTETYLSLDDTNHVVSLLDQSFQQHSTDAGYWTMLGDLTGIALRQRPSIAPRLNSTLARQCYERALTLAPKSPEILVRVADAYLNANDLKGAADTYAKLLELRPNLPQVRERLAAVYLQTDQKAKAAALYKELIKRDPLRFEFYNVLGELQESDNKLEEALNFFTQSLKLNPDQSDIYLAICELQRHLKRPAAGAKTLAAWKKRFPVDWRAPYFSALLHSGNQDFTNAVAAYAEAEALAHDAPSPVKLSAQFYFSYGAACERAGDLDKAAAEFRQVIALDPKSANACNYLGYMWVDHNTNLTEALVLIQQAIASEPNNGAYRDSLGWALHKLGRDSEALAELRSAVVLLDKEVKADPEERRDDAVVYDHLADVLLNLQHTAEAVAVWKQALKLDPTNQAIAAKIAAHSPPK